MLSMEVIIMIDIVGSTILLDKVIIMIGANVIFITLEIILNVLEVRALLQAPLQQGHIKNCF